MRQKLKKLIKSRLFQSVSAAGLFLALGVFLGINSWDKTVYIQLKPEGRGRYVASTGGEDDKLVSLSLREYREQIHKKLFGRTKTEGEGEVREFYLGNFLIQEDGAHQWICQAHSYLEMKFTALGLALSGSAGEMVIQAPCQMENEEFIGPFPIPVENIVSHPEQTAFSDDEREVSIRFYNAAPALTESWLLTAVRFFNSPEESGFIVRFIPGEEAEAFELNFH